MAEGKWIPGLTARTPLDEAARRVLHARLRVVAHFLPLAATEAHSDVEHVHQLRVGTRRATAALDIFECCLSRKEYRSARRLLRRLRRAAGEARDWDVFAEMLSESAALRKRGARPALDFLGGFAAARRMAAQEHLAEVAERRGTRLEEVSKELPEAPRPSKGTGDETLGDLATVRLGELFHEFNAAAGRMPESDEELHQVRILGKRLRYAMEIFADCFAPPFRERLYPAVEDLQEILGTANDSRVTVARLSAITEHLRSFRPGDWPRLRPGLEGLSREHGERRRSERERYREWWPNWQRLLEELPLETLRAGEATESPAG